MKEREEPSLNGTQIRQFSLLFQHNSKNNNQDQYDDYGHGGGETVMVMTKKMIIMYDTHRIIMQFLPSLYKTAELYGLCQERLLFIHPQFYCLVQCHKPLPGIKCFSNLKQHEILNMVGQQKDTTYLCRHSRCI